MSRQFVAACELADWQVAPSESDLANYDDHKIKYRRLVEDMIQQVSRKSLLKKTFITISVNVLCADLSTKSQELQPIERDVYLPLEIALTKWNMADRETPAHERQLKTYHWIINPGEPTRNCVNVANEHAKSHKIVFKKLPTEVARSDLVENDLDKVLKDINSVLLPDRTVFSLGIKKCRQDLGALKWLVLQTRSKFKPVNVYSLDDLFVAVNRQLWPVANDHICQGVAQHVLHQTINPYEEDAKCDFHQKLTRDTDDDCGCCAKALAECSTNAFLNFTDLSVRASTSSFEGH